MWLCCPSSLSSWSLLAGENNGISTVEDGQRDTRVVEKNDDSSGACIVKDEQWGETMNPLMINGERVRPVATTAVAMMAVRTTVVATIVTDRRHRPPPLLFFLSLVVVCIVLCVLSMQHL